MKKNLTPLMISLLLAAPAPAAAVSAARQGGDGGVILRASVPLGGIVNTGDRVAFEFQTRKDAAVLVFSIDSRGFVHLLYPAGPPEVARANTEYSIPEYGSELVVDTPTGVEFAFALAVTDPGAIDAAELAHLRGTDVPGAEPYRITGDPFIAANMVAAELVRGVSHQEVYFGYTNFYVNQRVEYPCYLCGACDGVADVDACGEYRVVQNFQRGESLVYPLPRGYDMVEQVADGSTIIDNPDDGDVVVNFYPYGSEVRYVDPSVYLYPGGWGLWDPFYWYWPGYYPYCGSGWSVGIGWGWGWGWGGWGGYYSCGWYAPPCYYPSYPYYPSGGYTYPEKFKTRYKSGDVQSGSLTAQRTRAAQRDGSLRIAQKDVQRSVTRANRTSLARSTRSATRATVMAGRYGTPRVKTTVSGTNRGKTAVRGTTGRTGSRPTAGVRSAPATRSGSKPAVRGSTPQRTRGSSGTVRPAPSSRGSSSGIKGAPRGSSSRGSSGVKSRGSSARGGSGSRSAPAARGGSAKGGSRSR